MKWNHTGWWYRRGGRGEEQTTQKDGWKKQKNRNNRIRETSIQATSFVMQEIAGKYHNWFARSFFSRHFSMQTISDLRTKYSKFLAIIVTELHSSDNKEMSNIVTTAERAFPVGLVPRRAEKPRWNVGSIKKKKWRSWPFGDIRTSTVVISWVASVLQDFLNWWKLKWHWPQR